MTPPPTLHAMVVSGSARKGELKRDFDADAHLEVPGCHANMAIPSSSDLPMSLVQYHLFGS